MTEGDHKSTPTERLHLNDEDKPIEIRDVTATTSRNLAKITGGIPGDGDDPDDGIDGGEVEKR